MVYVALVLFMIGSIFCSLSEVAFTRLSQPRAHAIIRKEPAYSKLINLWLHNPGIILGFIVVVNTFFNSAFSFLYSGIKISPLASTILSFIIVFFLGEFFPKLFAVYNSNSILRIILPFFNFLSPFYRKQSGVSTPTISEVEAMLKSSVSTGEMGEEGKILINVIKSHNKKIRDIMVKKDDVEYCEPGSPVIKLIATNRTRIPVLENGVYTGYINVVEVLKDLRRSIDVNLNRYIKKPLVIDIDTSLFSAIQIFKNSKKHIAFVMENNEFAGIVTLEDIFEEIVGEILDEYDIKSR